MSLIHAGYSINVAVYADNITCRRWLASCVATVGGRRGAAGGGRRQFRLRPRVFDAWAERSTCRCLWLSTCRPRASRLSQCLQQAIRRLWEPLARSIAFFTHADDSRGSKAFSGICVSVCLFVRTIKPKRLKLKSQNGSQEYSIMSPRPLLNIRSKSQRSRSEGQCKKAIECPTSRLVCT